MGIPLLKIVYYMNSVILHDLAEFSMSQISQAYPEVVG
jgi:hypothetical protein